jgi:chitin disaccharide deacetylase
MNKRVIIHADDFGLTQGINRAIFDLVEAGILTSTSVMTNIPHFQEVTDLNYKIGIGIHLNLTEGRPLNMNEKIVTLLDNTGNFHDYSILINKVLKGKISAEEVELELNAQIEQLIDLGIKPSHIDTHESFFKYPFFIPIIRRLAKKHNILGIRTYTPRRFDYSRLLNPKKILISILLLFQKYRWKKWGFRITDEIDSLIEFGLDYETAIRKAKDIFSGLPDGVLEFVVHPGYSDGDISLLGGYVKEREIELQVLLSEEFRNILKTSDVKLITYNDILK